MTLHAVGMGSRPCGRCCYPRAAPRGRAVSLYAGAAFVGATALAAGLPLVASQRAVAHTAWLGVLHMPVGASHAHGRPRMLAAAPTRGFDRGRSPPCWEPLPQTTAPCNRPGHGWPALHRGWPPLLLAAFAAKTQQ
ncbi:hypothetical protein B296_00037360 [Ensete ventricosum]|uniref:Uncharacterized protein n=1 Tax=Ensete ventricosum TaxID=4639 RepID=A0A426YS02_ENSVE|nr:hypothetical protein B296_00037360 [Ensete ventricosum]